MTARRIGIVVALVVGGLVALNLLARGIDRAIGGSQPTGVAGSSYATRDDGIAAYAALLAHFGHEVTQQRGTLASTPPAPDSTLIVLEPQVMTTDDTAALLDFVTAGGRLVIGGQAPFYVKNLRDRAPAWDPAGRSAWLVDDPALPGVRSIETAAQGSWTSPGSGRVVVGDASRALVTLDRVAAGSIVFLADPSPLENAYLDHADNAAFGLDLAGGRPVVFAEGVHGFGRTRGVAAIPGAWKVALVLIGIAALAFVWSRARRFGPPDREARELPPARAEYVEALSLSLERTRDRAGALAPAQRFALDRIAARDALGATPDAEELARAARRIGCSDEEVAALVTPVATDAEVLAVGRAVSRVSAPAGARGGRTG